MRIAIELECPVCEARALEAETHDLNIVLTHGETVTVTGLENYRCTVCDADPAFPDQIKRNESKVDQFLKYMIRSG